MDRGAFYGVTFFCISLKNLLGGFFYRLNAKARRLARLFAPFRWSDGFGAYFVKGIPRSLQIFRASLSLISV
ncbi:MAG: hypothetical protein MUP18_05495 [Desulfobacterales bacterium]|nr:hypothetical protein [Desulfobacterales bacterium]